MSFSMRSEVPGPGRSALGGKVSPSYIWTAMAEIQSGHVVTAAQLEANSAVAVLK
jgi:hypothetical protein